MLFDQLDERINAIVGERHDLFVAWSIDPDHAVLGIQAQRYFVQPVDVLTEVGRDAVRFMMIFRKNDAFPQGPRRGARYFRLASCSSSRPRALVYRMFRMASSSMWANVTNPIYTAGSNQG